MPLYEYVCTNEDCGVKEELQLSTDKLGEMIICAKCLSPMKRVWNCPTINWNTSGGTNAGKG